MAALATLFHKDPPHWHGIRHETKVDINRHASIIDAPYERRNGWSAEMQGVCVLSMTKR